MSKPKNPSFEATVQGFSVFIDDDNQIRISQGDGDCYNVIILSPEQISTVVAFLKKAAFEFDIPLNSSADAAEDLEFERIIDKVEKITGEKVIV